MGIKTFIVIGGIAILAVAIVFRVPALRGLVTGASAS